MNHQLGYQIAQQRIADLQRATGRERLARTASNHRSLTNNRRVVTRLLTRIAPSLTPVSWRQASDPRHTQPSGHTAGEIR